MIEVREELTKIEEDGKRPEVDQKQSFVDMVSEGLQAKIPADRFVEGDGDEEEPTAAQTEEAKSVPHEDVKEEEVNVPAEESKIAEKKEAKVAETHGAANDADNEPEAKVDEAPAQVNEAAAKASEEVAATDAPAKETDVEEEAAVAEPAQTAEE